MLKVFVHVSNQDACAALLREFRLSVQQAEDDLTEAGSSGNHGDPSSDFILVIDGSTLDWALQEALKSDFLELSCKCKAVICCRSTPLQKSQVVQLIRDQLSVMTLAVGKHLALNGLHVCFLINHFSAHRIWFPRIKPQV